MLAGLRCIDVLTLRKSANDPNLGLKMVKPDVLIVSSSTKDMDDKKKKEMSKYCGEIIVLEAQATISTTSRLRKLLIDGASDLGKKIQNTIEDYLKKT
jgi:bifunctional ADP-heptose synthase (sugar kinase/adenylyltransferase)